jgi:hypothetical protein
MEKSFVINGMYGISYTPKNAYMNKRNKSRADRQSPQASQEFALPSIRRWKAKSVMR